MFRFSIVFFLLISTFCNAQDTLVLITGKIIPVKSVDLSDYTITYRTIDGTKLKTIDPARVFSIKYANGAERVIFQTDSLDPIDFRETILCVIPVYWSEEFLLLVQSMAYRVHCYMQL